MHLKELPYYQANAFLHLEEHTKAQHLMTKYIREWNKIKDVKDNGYFTTTPFFIPFVDEPSKLRRAQYLYLTALCNDFIGNKEKAAESICHSVELNNENLFSVFFHRFGFL